MDTNRQRPMIKNGLGAGRIPRAEWVSEQREQRSLEMLCRSLNLGTTVAFVGAGCSIPFGYPTWKKLIQDAIADLPANVPAEKKDALTASIVSRPERFLFALEECRRLSGYSEEDYNRLLAKLIRRGESEPRPNPLECLLSLPIHRFATTNYDKELERHLEKRPARDTPIAFTQELKYARQLSEFVLARRPKRDMVFHCHGTIDEPASIIATESDYQAWYLNRHDTARRGFDQTIELLLGSNPIFFVGYSLGDEDLMRYLRMLGATEAKRKDDRPLFALLACWEKENELDDEYWFHRYGLHVLRYPFNASERQTYSIAPEPLVWNRLFCKGLKEIRERWNEWQYDWSKKPKFRRITIPQRAKLFIHYEWGVSKPLGAKRLRDDLADIRRIIEGNDRPRVLVLHGPGGCGKSLRALRLIMDVGAGFFWSSYYSDDWLTGLDRATEWLSIQSGLTPSGKSRIEQFRELLGSDWAARNAPILVFDGFERLLQSKEMPETGETYSATVREFLDAVKSPESKATVILTTRLWPARFGKIPSATVPDAREAGASKAVRIHRVRPFVASELADTLESPFARLGPEGTSALCSLLNGHAFALRLAQVFLNNGVDVSYAAQSLILSLQRTPPHARVSRMIEMVIEEALIPKASGRLPASDVRGLLERVAIFMSPVDSTILETCLSLSRSESAGSANFEGSAVEIIRQFVDAGIATEVRDPAAGDNRWTLHPLVRGYVFHRLHGTRSEDLPNFTLPGYTSGTAAVDPGQPAAAKEVTSLLMGLLNAMEDEGGDDERRLHLCRAAVSVMRSRMEANTTARWWRYDDYIRLCVRVVNAVKQLSIERQLFWSRSDGLKTLGYGVESFEVTSTAGVLYPEEVAWLYNDIGLACCCEGEMHDAYALWEAGYEINKLIEQGQESGQFTVQSLLHLSHSFMEMGNLFVAEQYLVETEKYNQRLGSQDYAGRIGGYRGLLEHLRGNVRNAAEHYGKALRLLSRGGGNPRAESKFLQHRADLRILLKDLDGADEDIRVSIAIASEGDHPDLVAHARNSLGHLLRSRRKYSEARHEYQAAFDTARRKGIRRLEADVLSELSRLALDLGDSESAMNQAMKSMSIANELGLGIRQCHGLVVLGTASLMAEQREMGVAFLQTAWRRSRDSGYWLRAQEADKLLRSVGERPEENANESLPTN